MFDSDLIIIGAGINGAGVARDSAMRGLKVVLLDKGDVGSGTSSWSTRLIHGGLRYLEHGELGLVRESLRERETLLRIAPHLVRPLPFLLPIYRHARRGPLLLRLGMIMYDLLSLGKSLPRHQMLSTREALARTPGLNQDGLRGAALYYDAHVEFAERLVVENALSAIEHGAQVSTYTRVSEFIVENGHLLGVQLEDRDGRHRSATAPVIINAAGPWVDKVLAGVNPAPRLIGGTKGSHLIVPRFAGAPDTAIYLEAKTDQRPFFVIPWNGNHLIGTTDSRYEGDLDDVRIDEDEVEYLLSETNAVFPSAKLRREDILYCYSGVRTLPFTKETDEQSITRRHFIRPHPKFNNLLSLVGGKLTTYRSLAEEATDLVFTKLGRASPPCQTAQVRLGEPSLTGKATLLTARLNRIYGARATAITELVETNPELAEVFDGETGAIRAEIVYAFEHEFASTLVDCLMRRTMVGLNSTGGLDAVERAATVAQKHFGWSESRVTREVATYRKEAGRRSLLSNISYPGVETPG
ncbi:MAG: glycerol-3-phosphate dehydrogenase [Pyrinomonadaceae bacterium]